MKDSTGSNAAAILFELAEQAGKLFRRTTRDSLACGQLLLRAREIADHGSWQPFLLEAGIHPRTAQRLIKVAEYAGSSPAKCDIVSHLGVTRSLEFFRARDHAMAAWWAACSAEPDDHELLQTSPDCPLSGLVWCDDPTDRAVLLEVAAHVYDVPEADLLVMAEAAMQ